MASTATTTRKDEHTPLTRDCMFASTRQIPTNKHTRLRSEFVRVERVTAAIAKRETPGPIPNPEVKPFSADGTATERLWESRTPPDIHCGSGVTFGWPHFCISGRLLDVPAPRTVHRDAPKRGLHRLRTRPSDIVGRS